MKNGSHPLNRHKFELKSEILTDFRSCDDQKPRIKDRKAYEHLWGTYLMVFGSIMTLLDGRVKRVEPRVEPLANCKPLKTSSYLTTSLVPRWKLEEFFSIASCFTSVSEFLTPKGVQIRLMTYPWFSNLNNDELVSKPDNITNFENFRKFAQSNIEQIFKRITNTFQWSTFSKITPKYQDNDYFILQNCFPTFTFTYTHTNTHVPYNLWAKTSYLTNFLPSSYF